jgi:hypothetical protein
MLPIHHGERHESRPSKAIFSARHADENLIPYHNETTLRRLRSKKSNFGSQKNVFNDDSRRLQNEKWPESLPAIP